MAYFSEMQIHILHLVIKINMLITESNTTENSKEEIKCNLNHTIHRRPCYKC